MTEDTQELDKILAKLARETTLADRSADSATTANAVKDAGKIYQWSLGDAKQAILDWHNKQILELLDRLETQALELPLSNGREMNLVDVSALEAERNRLTDIGVGELKAEL